MDIMKPPLIRVGNRQYRLFTSNKFVEHEQSLDMFEDDEEEFFDKNLELTKTPQGYELSLKIPSPLMKFFVGYKGETKRRIQYETSTSFTVTKHNDYELVVIRGSSKKNVVAAKTRIEIILENNKEKVSFTHFLSIPLNSPCIKEHFDTFRRSVLQKFGTDRGVEQSLFQNASKLHLTLGTLTILTSEDEQKACQSLSEVSPILRSVYPNGFDLALRGLEYMNDDPSMVDVLYAKVSCGMTESLNEAAERILDIFVSQSLMVREHEKVKFHVTLLNSLFRSGASGSGNKGVPKSKERESFDASRILKEFADFDFGSVPLTSVHLSRRFSSDAKTGYYKALDIAYL